DPFDMLPELRYDRMFEAIGCHGEHVTRPDEIRPALERAMAAGKPSVVNVIGDPRIGHARLGGNLLGSTEVYVARRGGGAGAPPRLPRPRSPRDSYLQRPPEAAGSRGSCGGRGGAKRRAPPAAPPPRLARVLPYFHERVIVAQGAAEHGEAGVVA